MRLSLIAQACLVLLAPGGTASSGKGTRDYSYQFNSVAVTGGGYITGIIAHPAERDLMYTRTDIGSTYRWSAPLNKWIPLTDFISQADDNLMGTESYALDPNNVDRLYLAQGRYLSSNNSAFFVSDDRGKTFDIHSAPWPMGANELGRNNGERLAVNPFNGDELWFGTRTAGLWRSGDRARTWSNVTKFPDAFANTIGIQFVIFDPKHEGTVYVGGFGQEPYAPLADLGPSLYYTTDGGDSWDAIPGQSESWDDVYIYTNETEPQTTAPQAMKAVLASNGMLYVTFGDFPGPYGTNYGLAMKYDTKTQQWSNITPKEGTVYPPPYEPQAFPSGGYCGISVSHSDPDTLVLASLDRDPGPALDSMYVSRDGGETWKDFAQLSTPNQESVNGYWGHSISESKLKNGTAVPWLNFDWSPRWGGYGAPSPIYGLTKFGWWMTAVLLSPWDPEHLMYGTGATIWSTDDLLSATKDNDAPGWYIQAQGIEETVPLYMTSPTKGPQLYVGFGDINGQAFRDLDVPQPMFDLPTYSNLNGIDWAGQRQNVVVKIGANGIENTTDCKQGAISRNYGGSWNTFESCIPGVNSSTTGSGTIAIDASGDHIVWTSTGTERNSPVPVTNVSGPYFSSAYNTSSWSSPTGLTLQTPNISSDRVQRATFYSFTDGAFYVSYNGGKSYKSRANADIGLPGDWGAVPIVSPYRAGEIWLSLGEEGIFYSKNFGRRWRRVTKPGVVPELFTIGAPARRSRVPALYLWGVISSTSDFGLYRSDDNGGSWARINDETHQYGGLEVIAGDPRVYGRVYMGTEGRGIVRADISRHVDGNVLGTGGI